MENVHLHEEGHCSNRTLTPQYWVFLSSRSSTGQMYWLSAKLSQQEMLKRFVVISPEGCFTKSTAVLHIVRHLGSLWRMLYIFILLPQSLRGIIYAMIARYRYQLRGTLATCYRPLQEYQDRFRDNV